MRAVRGVRRVAPLFPYYLIVRVTESLDWRVLSSTRGVASVLMNGLVPGRVSDQSVEALCKLTNTIDGYYHDPAQAEHKRFRPGQAVEGLRGLFKDKFGIYRGLANERSSERVRVLFRILGREALFEMNADDLVAVDSIAA